MTVHAHHAAAPTTPEGLQVSRDGYTLVPVAAPAGTFAFRIDGPDGAPVREYLPQHDKDLHLIVVRRDLSGFRHVHPVLGEDGVWTQELTLDRAGTYRVFTDFAPAATGIPLTLAVDVHVAGDFRPVPLPVPAPTAEVDGYTVTLAGEPAAGQGAHITLSVARGGRPVTDLEPYLAAFGHLVVLREGDLAYLHVHPGGAPGDGVTPAGPEIAFHTELPSVGTYRFFLDFKHGGVVRTAEFTVEADKPGAPGGHGHGQPEATDPHAEHHGHHGHHHG
ncbi:hypothetical protein [Embleya scabrispora]|uniref:hypothetical protein n=1 Tax=Embleya scabrispora TaxID=159449 RepID=UPI00035D9ACD|nr:hypothetical protein [Embleya scabrispora]MYS82994.1 hypothetical protein [Streptomyces sp. SID5474]